MNRIISSLVLICSINMVFGQTFYTPTTVNTLELNFFDAAWRDSLDYYQSISSENRMMANCIINGIPLDSVGVKFKGNSSYSASNIKNPMNIKLNYIKNQDYDGYNVLKLSNVFKDPSFVREVMAYEIARNYTTAPKSSYANVTIDGNLIGLFVNDQSINDKFTSENYGSSNLPLFKAESIFGPPVGSCPGGPPSTMGYFGTDTTCYPSHYEIKSNFGWTDLMHMSDTFNNYLNNMEDVLYVDRHIWALAFDNLFVNLDSPINTAHNFYLYKDNTDRFNHIIWDLNECFGVFTMGISGGITALQQLDVFFHETSSSFPDIGKPLSINRYRKMYIAHMKTIYDESVTSGWYESRAYQLQAIIDPYVNADPNKFYTYSDFQNNVANSAASILGIKELMDGRSTYLNSTPEFGYSQPVITAITPSPTLALINSTVIITANISNNNYAYLGYRNSQYEKFIKVEMFDDGVHNDGSASDGVWGVSIPTLSSDIQYYIYAENTNAGAFSPVRAEYDFYTLSVQHDVVLNEFQASNSATQIDQNWEYDDWIELYNNASTSVNLLGYYLTDDPTNLQKWAFPDTTIPAGGYLIVWADHDTLQTGLHANFKLSSTGESLILVNNTAIVDEYTFGTQITDHTTGRYPNGTGPMIEMLPTFSAYNSNLLSVNEIENQLQLTIYPNPATNQFTIETNDSFNHNLTLFNMQGMIIKNMYFSNTATMDVSGIASGIYLVKVDNTIKKLIIR